MFVAIVNVAAGVLGVGAIFALMWLAARGDPDRVREEAARAHFDRHGRWPDEGV